MKYPQFAHLLTAGMALVVAGLQTALAQTAIEEMVVTADFRATDFLDSTTSLSIVDQQDIEGRGATQLEEILNLAPNLNFAAGASRGRYLQIRGIGERSQFVDPISPSVGLIIDGVDFSRMGGAALLFDTERVEILRGPQGTRYGASGLAGLVHIRSTEATAESAAELKIGAGNYGRTELGATLNGALTTELNGRLAISGTRSDGFVHNTFLDRPTNQINELGTRAKLNWSPGDAVNLDVSYLHVDIENGYDAFSLDNNRRTLSDEPGRDHQRSDAFILQTRLLGQPGFDIELTAAWQQTAAEYGFDEDWTHTEICEGLACDSDDWGFDWWYSTTDNYQRQSESAELDLRLLSKNQSTDWVAGLFYRRSTQDLHRDFFDWDLYSDSTLQSRYTQEQAALYGQWQNALTDRLQLTLGGRLERLGSDYSDSRAVAASPAETQWGGEISLAYDVRPDTMVYALLSRGFKTGGVNGDALGNARKNDFDAAVIEFLNQRLAYATETALNLELGAKMVTERGVFSIAAFHMQRDQVQLKGWYNEGPLFVGYTDNGASGTNTGLEVEGRYWLNDRMEIFAGLGLLQTEIEDFVILDGGDLMDQSGREQAHAPNYQFNLGTALILTERWRLRLEMEGKDSFYFSDSHDQQSEAFVLLHARLAYAWRDLELGLWGRNLTNTDYQVRGFYFANDPRDFYAEDETYVQLGSPRSFGLTAKYTF